LPINPLHIFRVKNLPLSGSVKLSCPKGKKELMFNYKYSSTPAVASSFIEIGALPRVTRTIAGLTKGVEYTFMYCAISNAGQTDWSNEVVLVIT
jgi:hypothetical protein